ncbi:WD40 repeat-like protein [Leucogyrophana mollusca]|uniref:WD40 repeat-like protein n=1 Tax=Leucogyrophana mollusca TaxID=85980 RepID=A0ACB8B426_9AGAM|nr:WD40 repeat-like protein [Leucogyrophana mollusca]
MSTLSNPIELAGAHSTSCRPTRVFEGHSDWVNSVVYFPDVRRIASASNDKTVILWDVESGRQDERRLQHDSSVRWIAISPDGKRIASGIGQGGLVIWDTLTQKVVHEVKGDGVRELAYSPDGRWILTAPMTNERVVQLWDADTGRPGGEPLKFAGSIFCVTFSPDGTRIAAGFRDGYFQVIDILTGESTVGPIKGHAEFVSSVVYSPDGLLLVTASADKSIRVWDPKTGVETGKPMLGHEYGVNCLSITADGRRVASGGNDKTVRVWDLETRLQVGDPFRVDAVDVWVLSVAFSPDGRYLISGGTDGVVSLWDTESLATQGSRQSVSPAASSRNPHVSTIQPIPPLRQQRQVRAKSHNGASSINSSLLDLPAVGQEQPAIPQERKPSVDDWDTESIRLRLDPPLKQEILPVQPAKPGHKWLRNIREHWRRIRFRKSRAPADIPNGSSHPSSDEQPPDSSELPTDPQTRATSTAPPSVPGHPWSRIIRGPRENIRLRRPRIPAALPDSSAPIPVHERLNAPVSSSVCF